MSTFLVKQNLEIVPLRMQDVFGIILLGQCPLAALIQLNFRGYQ